MNKHDLDWTQEEKEELLNRMLKLSDIQIAELFGKIGIVFGAPDSVLMKDIIQEIRSQNKNSMYLNIILNEATSREDILKAISFFEEES